MGRVAGAEGVTVTESHIMASKDLETKHQIEVLKKVVSEGLTARQTERLSEAYSAASSPQARKTVLRATTGGFVPSVADAKKAKRVSEAGRPEERWDFTTSEKTAIERIRSFRDWLSNYLEAAKLGKISIQGAKFIAREINRTIGDMERARDKGVQNAEEAASESK
jgi:GrpB-like predicted nucleotidyltransferase (UPF0157 family)